MRLRIIAPDGATSERTITAAVARLGREEGKVEFVLDHPHVSRRHARLTADGDRVVLQDLDSANGTHVNGQRIRERVALRPGDQIDIGPFSLKFDGEALLSRSRSNN